MLLRAYMYALRRTAQAHTSPPVWSHHYGPNLAACARGAAGIVDMVRSRVFVFLHRWLPSVADATPIPPIFPMHRMGLVATHAHAMPLRS